MFVEGSKVGYGRTAVTPLVEQNRELSKIEEQVSFSVSRNGQRTDEKIVSTALETPAGELVRFQTEINAGPEPMITRGEVRDGQMQFVTLTTGKNLTSAIAWPGGIGGFKAAEESLARQPLQPGESRKLAGLMIGFNEIAQIELTAADYEPTMLLDHSEDLLRIQWTATLPQGNVLRAVWWAGSARGKRSEDAARSCVLHQVTYSEPRAKWRLAESGPGQAVRSAAIDHGARESAARTSRRDAADSLSCATGFRRPGAGFSSTASRCWRHAARSAHGRD